MGTLIVNYSKNPDPYINNVVLYLKGDGANGTTTILDSSPSRKTVTNQGSVTNSTTRFINGGSSLLFGGSDSLTLASNADFAIGTGDFTLDFYVYFDGVQPESYTRVFSSGIGGSEMIYVEKSVLNTMTFALSLGVAPLYSSTLLDEWNHFAYQRRGTMVSLYKNGVLTGTTTSDINITNSAGITVGAWTTTDYSRFLNGNIDNLRLTKGVARYTGNFNPSKDTYYV